MIFKIGDVVECVESISKWVGGPRKGEKFTVRSVDSVSIGITLPRLDDTYSDNIKSGVQPNWDADYFQLAGTKAEMDETTLLQKITEGASARVELQKRVGTRLEFRRRGSGDWMPSLAGEAYDYRVKPIVSFRIGQGWEVVVSRTEVTIGCRTFPTEALVRALAALCRDPNTCSYEEESISLVASRNGPGVANTDYDITWEEADKLLAAIEKVTSA